ncbi:hypothetical protein ACEWY4_010158 [Coilia grayii]|uniref:C2H2-type domain-containing protein n=1 Tax=Coilia grayii TaxID=363190 RepID=A0ABD1K8N5_9TELE
MWKCKECNISVATRFELLKHIRLEHNHRQRYACIHTDCPCSFKTWNALHIHLSRFHHKDNFQESSELSTFTCHLCACCDLHTERDYFVHIGTHLRSNETVTCMFSDCSFQTNIYATFHSHKNRKHNPHTLKDFKPGIVRTTQSSRETCDVTENDLQNDDDDNFDEKFSGSCLSGPKNLTGSLLKLEHFAHVAGTKLDEFLEELHYLHSCTLPLSAEVLEELFQKHGVATDKSVILDIAGALNASNPIFKALDKGSPLSTCYLRNQYYKDTFKLVEPIEYILDCSKKSSFQYVPLLKSLRQLFEKKNIVDKVVENHEGQNRNRVSGEQHTYRSSQDGSYFKENAFLSGNELRILVNLYADDFEVCNPLGTSRRKHKLCGIYWTLSNMPPGSHSSLSSIYLAILCKSDDLKVHGLDRILHPLLRDVKTLEQDGLFIPLLGRCLKGTIQVVVADNLGAHTFAGFNESFSGGYICRFCTATKTDIQTNSVKSHSLTLRTNELHESHVQTAELTGTSCFGVKRHCSISKTLDHFNVLTGYPPDVMHDIFEGIVPVELARCLALLISKKYFDLDTLFFFFLNFIFYFIIYKTNRPHEIPRTFSTRKTIGGNCHENWALLRHLPFIIGHLVPDEEMEWQLLMDLKDIVELVVAPTHTDESIGYLEFKISDHRHKYQYLFPDVPLLPKHHFLEHYPQLIRAFGPLVGHWTLQFEAKHSFFKQVIRHTNCFKNVPLSLATKHQLMMSYHLNSSTYEKDGLEITKASKVPVDVLKWEMAQVIEQKFSSASDIDLTKCVSYKGVTYRNGMILVHGSTSGLPDFGEIIHICVVQKTLCFMVKRLSGWYREHFRAFELTPCPSKKKTFWWQWRNWQMFTLWLIILLDQLEW